MKKAVFVILGIALTLYGFFVTLFYIDEYVNMVSNFDSIIDLSKVLVPIMSIYLGIFSFSYGLSNKNNSGESKFLLILLFGVVVSSQLIFYAPDAIGYSDPETVRILNYLGIGILVFCIISSVIYSLASSEKEK